MGKYRVVGTISADHLVEKVESWFDNAVLGDMHIETTYSDYRDAGGIKFPAKIVQKQGGFPVLELTATEAKANVALDLTVPAAGSQPFDLFVVGEDEQVVAVAHFEQVESERDEVKQLVVAFDRDARDGLLVARLARFRDRSVR